MTPNSNPTSYVSNSNFLLRFDSNLVGQLVSDQNTQANPDSLITNPVLTQILLDSSGEFESATLIGGRYSVTDLQSLTGVSLGYMQRIISNLAMCMLRQRRGMIEEGSPGFCADAKNALAALASGAAILSFAQTEAAGSIYNRFMQRVDFATMPLVSNNQRMYGILADRARVQP